MVHNSYFGSGLGIMTETHFLQILAWKMYDLLIINNLIKHLWKKERKMSATMRYATRIDVAFRPFLVDTLSTLSTEKNIKNIRCIS